MLHRTLPDLPSPDAAGLDAAPTSAVMAVERGERHLAMLARLADMAMDLTETLHRKAKESIESPSSPSGRRWPEGPDEGADAGRMAGPDPVAAFNKTAQTVRRIIALEARLAAAVKTAREALIADRAAGRQARAEAKTDAVLFGFHDAWAADCPEPHYDERVENLMEDVREHLRDADEFRGWLDRPVGETVARLCAALDVDPAACAQHGDVWIVRRPPTELERSLPLYIRPDRPLPPVGGGEGGSARSDETGGARPPTPPDILDAARAPP